MQSSTVSPQPCDNHHDIARHDLSVTNSTAVKFDTAKLPPILNSLETENNGQKLVLEVAVCAAGSEHTGGHADIDHS